MLPQQTVNFPNLLCLSLVVTSIMLCWELSSHCTEGLPLFASGGTDVEFKHYCSTNLSDAIRLICGGRYYSLSRKYPDSVGMGSGGSGIKTFTDEDFENWQPFKGAINECCQRPCGYSELKSYCDPDY